MNCLIPAVRLEATGGGDRGTMPSHELCCVNSKDDLHDLHDDFLWRPDEQ
jgi:hypothetical protein